MMISRRVFIAKLALTTIAIPALNAMSFELKKRVAFGDIEKKVVDSTYERFRELKNIVGYTHFSIIDLDLGMRIYKNFRGKSMFSDEEFAFVERLFYTDAREFGFFGIRQSQNLFDKIDENQIIKTRNQYLFKGEPYKKYKILSDENSKLIMTSGIRGVAKQFYLFLGKVKSQNYDFKSSSISIAPPGYTYHFTRDFDIGQDDYGVLNFSEKFTESDVFKSLVKKGYIDLRYPEGNSDGVRFEPWHIKV